MADDDKGQAKLKRRDKPGEEVKVHFNPVSLQYTVTNTLKEQGKGKTAKQHVSQSTAKLTMDLVFDTTLTGEDVRATTQKIANWMNPDKDKAAPVIEFLWGVFKFGGMIEAYKETIDFFSPTGVPLRASVNLTLAQQDVVFTKDGAGETVAGKLALDTIEVPTAAGGSPSETATRAGDPSAARDIAAANGEESLRFTASASLAVSASVQLGAPVAFATGSAAFGAGIGASASFGASAGASFGAG
ncbi:MAG TPA: hypothetical protein VMZ71_17385, partial [Gemmataceae bacterium]|nr:hypothetical protein [Gemmataceae bacterium]